MAEHPAIAEVAVAGTRRADGVALMTAYIVPAGAPPAVDEMLAWTGERLAAYKCPKLIRFLGGLPRTANGKVVRARLGEAADGRAAPS